MAVNAAVAVVLMPGLHERIQRQLSAVLCLPRMAGFHRCVFRDLDGSQSRYMVFLPEQVAAGDRLPVVLYLNGIGENGEDGLMPLRNGLAAAIWERRQDFPYLVVWPQCPRDDSWSGDTVAVRRALAILDEAIRKYGGDSDRVLLTGLSSGGNGVWSIAADYPDRFAAIAPVSAGRVPAERLAAVTRAQLPVWMSSVENDKYSIVEGNRDAHRQLLANGADSRLTEFFADRARQMDTHDAWSATFRNPAFFEWMNQQHRLLRRSPESRLELVSPHLFASLVGSGKPQALSQVPTRDLVELQLEFLPAATSRTFGIGVFSRSGEVIGECIELSTGSETRGAVRQGQFGPVLGLLPTAADQLVTSGRWNELRLKFSAEQVTVDLNGWELPPCPASGRGTENGQLGFITTGAAEARVELRNLRVRRGMRTRSSELIVKVETNRLPPPPSAGSPPTVDQILIAWRQRSEMHGVQFLGWRTRAAALPPLTDNDSSVSPCSETSGQMAICKDSLQIRTDWRHPAIQIDRRLGLDYQSSQQLYARILNGGFEHQFDGRCAAGLQHEIVCHPALRRDEIRQSDGRGRMGVEYDTSDVWQERLGNLDDLLWRAPLLALHPLVPGGWSLQPDACQVRPEPSDLAGIACTVLEETTRFRNQTCLRQFWLDTARGFLPQRVRILVDGLEREAIELEYDYTPAVPHLKTWTVVTRNTRASADSHEEFPGANLLFQCATAQRIQAGAQSEQISHLWNGEDFRAGTTVLNVTRNQWSRQTGTYERTPLSAAEVSSITLGGQFSVNPAGTGSTVWYAAGLLALSLGGVALRLRRVSNGARP